MRIKPISLHIQWQAKPRRRPYIVSLCVDFREHRSTLDATDCSLLRFLSLRSVCASEFVAVFPLLLSGCACVCRRWERERERIHCLEMHASEKGLATYECRISLTRTSNKLINCLLLCFTWYWLMHTLWLFGCIFLYSSLNESSKNERFARAHFLLSAMQFFSCDVVSMAIFPHFN